MTLTDHNLDPVAAERITGLGSALRVALDGPYAAQRAVNRATFPAENLLRDPALNVEASRKWTLDRLRELSDQGFGSAGVPDSASSVADPLTAVMTFEMLSHGDLSVTIKSGVQFGLFGSAIANLGTQWHHNTYLRSVTQMTVMGGFAMTELGHGSDVASLETTMTYHPSTQEFEVHSPSPAATKGYIGNAARDGSMAVVFGQLIVGDECHGVHAMLMQIRDEAGRDLPGVTTGDQGHKGGLLGVDNGTISFDRVRVPRKMLLDRFGGVDESGEYQSDIADQNRRFFTMLGTLVRGRVCIAAGGGIAARRALSIATRYALNRRQFPAPGRTDGVLLLDYLTHQTRLLPRIARAYALGFAQNELVQALVHVQGSAPSTELDQRQLETRAAGLKAVTTWFANDTLQEAREACGGAGYLSENQLTALRSDVDVFATFEGDNTVLLQLVTKGLLTNYKKEWSELDRSGVVQATTRVLGASVVEAIAANVVLERLASSVRREPEKATLVDRRWQAMMFEDRANHSLESLARRMRSASKDGSDTFEAFNRLGNHVQFVAKAHMERVIFQAFIDGIEECHDAQARRVLEKLCSVFALDSIGADRAWFLEHNRMSSTRAKAVGAHIEALCRDLRPHALPLVEGMGVPKAWLHAAIVDDL